MLPFPSSGAIGEDLGFAVDYFTKGIHKVIGDGKMLKPQSSPFRS